MTFESSVIETSILVQLKTSNWWLVGGLLGACQEDAGLVQHQVFSLGSYTFRSVVATFFYFHIHVIFLQVISIVIEKINIA